MKTAQQLVDELASEVPKGIVVALEKPEGLYEGSPINWVATAPIKDDALAKNILRSSWR
jgi:hypothetical protein